MPRRTTTRRRRVRVVRRLLPFGAGVLLLSLLAALGLLAHLALVQPRAGGTTAPAARPHPTARPTAAASGPASVAPPAGGALTILFTDTDAEADALLSTLNGCPTPDLPPPCVGTGLAVLVLGPSDQAAPYRWLSQQHGQVLTALDLRTAAAVPARPPPWWGILPASPSPSGPPTYCLLVDMFTYQALMPLYLTAPDGSVFVPAPTPADAERIVLVIAAENARRSAAGLPLILVVDGR